LLGTVTIAYHNGLPFIPLRYNYVTLISVPQFTSLHCTAFLDDLQQTLTSPELSLCYQVKPTIWHINGDVRCFAHITRHKNHQPGPQLNFNIYGADMGKVRGDHVDENNDSFPYLFTCRFNSPERSYKVAQKLATFIHIIIIIIIIIIIVIPFKLFACKSFSLLTQGLKTYLLVYGGVLLSTPLHASSNFTVSVQLANKRGLI
jgi:hypothetical protein